MSSSDKLQTILRLQQFISSKEEGKLILPNLPPKILLEVNSLGLDYQFISAVFLDANSQVQLSFFVDKDHLKDPSVKIENPISFQKLFKDDGKWDKELLWGKPLIAPDPRQLLLPIYPNAENINSLLILPIIISAKVSGAVILASNRDQKTITKEELEYLELIVNLVNDAYRLYDIQTSLTQVTQEVYKMNIALHELDKLKDDFVSVASHELRTPMTAIRSYSWMALNKSDVLLSDKLKRYLSRTLISTERLINLVNDMLNISRIESGRIEISPKSFDIIQLVGEVVNEVSTKAAEKSLNLQLDKSIVPQVFADPDKLHQVLLNLLGNALKFTSSGGEISVSFYSDGNTVEISIKDSGVGISKDDMSRLFKKFGRLDNSYVAAATTGGTGLGLFICKSLIELMKGKIWARSDGLGKGSTFVFSLPVATPEVLKKASSFTQKATGEAKGLEPVAL